MKQQAVLEWQASKDDRKYEVYRWPAIDILARVVCRREIEEAKKRVIIERGKFFYQPSLNYIRARLGFHPKKFVNNGTNRRKNNPFKEP